MAKEKAVVMSVLREHNKPQLQRRKTPVLVNGGDTKKTVGVRAGTFTPTKRRGDG
jgi:hypothetical protein